jgi:hypothetical protein
MVCAGFVGVWNTRLNNWGLDRIEASSVSADVLVASLHEVTNGYGGERLGYRVCMTFRVR